MRTCVASIYLMIISVGVIGGLLCLAAYVIESQFWSHLIADFGTAIIIAATLAGTIDAYFKANLLKDAFDAVFGYVLPEYFREELNRIAQQVFIAKRATLELSITRIDTDLVEIVWGSYREIENITNKSAKFDLVIGLDDFGFSGTKSKLHDCKIRMPNGTDRDHSVMIKGTNSDPHRAGKLESDSEYVPIPSKATFSIYQKISETHRANGTSYWIYFQPCRNPEIRITCPSDIVYLIDFLHPNVREEQLEPNRFKLVGTFLPHQPVIVRWWPKGFNAREHGAKNQPA